MRDERRKIENGRRKEELGGRQWKDGKDENDTRNEWRKI